ncbi:hypothetical protein BDP27DRAFT_293931 [Rhodocollybia butyracea]|uniref:Uncharacterized protein n=1 Tax=Rhodocollybia butyracea TaxID=206335 RepID=A0A9P5U1G9_9AGAR|nr:hypothetical protein BDP27DRAFT_293931 [Rhodocollybia butyracea]
MTHRKSSISLEYDFSSTHSTNAVSIALSFFYGHSYGYSLFHLHAITALYSVINHLARCVLSRVQQSVDIGSQAPLPLLNYLHDSSSRRFRPRSSLCADYQSAFPPYRWLPVSNSCNPRLSPFRTPPLRLHRTSPSAYPHRLLAPPKLLLGVRVNTAAHLPR